MHSKRSIVKIRKALESEAGLLAKLIRRASLEVAERLGLTEGNCPKHPSNCEEAWVRADFEKGTVYYLLETGSGPAGCVAMERADSENCYLERLAVLPEVRRKGYGRELVDHVLAEAGKRSFCRVGIGTIAQHGELLAWYRKIGFVEGETRKFDHLPFDVTFMTFAIVCGD